MGSGGLPAAFGRIPVLVNAGLLGSVLIRYAPRGRELSLVTDLAAWTSSSVALYGLLAHLAGHRRV